MDRHRYIKNKGITKLVIKNNSKKDEKTFKWNIDYDGNEADVELDIKDNKNRKHYNWKLDNDDLAKILNVPTVEKPIDQRLRDDFLLKDIEESHDREELMMPLSLDMSPLTPSPEPEVKMIVLREPSFSPRRKSQSIKVYRKTPKPKTVRIRLNSKRRSSSSKRSSKGRRISSKKRRTSSRH